MAATTTLGFVLPTGLSPRRGGFRVSLIRCSASPLTTNSTASGKLSLRLKRIKLSTFFLKNEANPFLVGLVEKPWNTYDARLVLEDGSIWPAKSFGAPGTRIAELVFNTSLTG